MAKDAGAREKHTTIAVSHDFAEMINALARSKGLSVRDYCDEHGAPRFTADYQSHLTEKLKKATRGAKAAKAGG